MNILNIWAAAIIASLSLSAGEEMSAPRADEAGQQAVVADNQSPRTLTSVGNGLG